MLRGFFSRKVWFIHNPLKSWTLKDLSEQELRLVVGTLTTVERQHCLVWKKDWKQWQPLNKTEKLSLLERELCELSHLPEGAPPLPSSALALSEDEITQVKIIIREPDRLVEDRRHGRHEICVPVEIIQGSQVFRTQTLDISASGMRFKDPIPEWVAGYFTVLFSDPKSFEITCALVEDQKHNKNCAEVFDTNDEESGLKTYLEWVASLNKTD